MNNGANIATSPVADDESKIRKIIGRLLKSEAESEIIEFKHNNTDKEAIGEYISALANSAALEGRTKAFMLWGVEDQSHRIVGTSFRPMSTKGKGNEDLTNWLLQHLKPHCNFNFRSVTIDGANVVLLQIDRASRTPVSFQGQRFIRIGSQKKNLQDFPDVEARLFAALNAERFEELPAKSHLDEIEILNHLAYPEFFNLMGVPTPDGRKAILASLQSRSLVEYAAESGWSITNLGAVLLAKKLEDFPTVARKALRIIRYKGNDKVETFREYPMVTGYAVNFDNVIDYIMGQLPQREEIQGAYRVEIGYPKIAIRELVANALIHQDFTVSGAGPMVEIFDDRIQILNPGASLVPADRLVNEFRSRNEQLAGVMRLLSICEERGSGWDKVADAVAAGRLPAPRVDVQTGATQVIVFGPKPLSAMDKIERRDAVYLETCLQYERSQPMTNSTVRARFGLTDKQKGMATGMLNDAVAAGLISVFDPEVGPTLRRYIPAWAVNVDGNE